MSPGAERSDLPPALKGYLNEFHNSDHRQVELSKAILVRSIADCLDGKERTAPITVSHETREYKLWLERQEKGNGQQVQFVIKPTIPDWSSSDVLFTIDEDNTLLDDHGDEVDELETISDYIDMISFLNIRLYPLRSPRKSGRKRS